MVLYNKDKFKEILSEFILCSEQGFETLKGKDYGRYVMPVQEDLYKLVIKKVGEIISKQLDPKDYDISNLIRVNVCLPSYKNEVLYALGTIFTSKMQIEILEYLRGCKSWEEIIYFKDRFIEIYREVGEDYKYKLIDSFKNDEGVLFLIYVMYLAKHGIYAIDESLYNELNVSKKGIDRPRFDYIRNGLPFSTRPYIHIPAEADSEEIGFLHNTMIEIEKEFLSYGELSPSLMSNFKFMASCHKTLVEELAYASISKDKFKALVYRYIDILESSVLACSESYIEIDHDNYTKVLEFNDKYKNIVLDVETVEELETILETYSESYAVEAKELQDAFIDYASGILSCNDLFNMRKILIAFQDKYISKSEILVISNHADKLKSMFMGFGKENLDPVTQVLIDYFIITEDRISEIKKKAELIGNGSVSTKKINKKIAKYKKAFHFKEINKLAEEAGFYKVRQNGDHGIFQKLDGTTVVIPQGRNIGKGLSYKIQKDIQMA